VAGPASPKKEREPIPHLPAPPPPCLDRQQGRRHNHHITAMGSLGTGRTRVRVWPLSDGQWLSAAEHTGPCRRKKTWGKTCFAQDFNISPYVPGSVPKMETSISQVKARNTFFCKDPLLPQATGLSRVITVVCVSGLDPTGRGLQPSLPPEAVSR